MSAFKADGLNVQMPISKTPKMNTDSKEKLVKAAGEFEGVFMDFVLKSMRDTVGDSDTQGDTEKVKFFQSMLDTEYSKELGAKGRIGLRDAIVRQLSPSIGVKK